MPTYRFPILIWQDFEGGFTALPVERSFSRYAAIGRTANDAVFQLKEYLTYVYDKYPWTAEPDFADAKLIHLKAEARPEYQLEESVNRRLQTNIYPVDKTFTLRVACVHGKQQSGLLVCALPLLEIQFYYYEEKTLRELATTYVQESLKGLTPRELSRFLPPQSYQLDEIVLSLSHQERRYTYQPSLDTLSRVAEPLGDKQLRKQYSAAWERDAEVRDLVQRIGREKANVIIVGDGGIGKTTVLVNAVRDIERQTEPREEGEDEIFYKHRYWLTSGARIIAGMQYLGQWEERCEELINELSTINGTLCVGSILDIVLTGGREASASIAAFFLPFLQSGELRLVGEATPAELDACRRMLPGFVGLFQILDLQPFNRSQATAILKRAVETFTRNYRVAAADQLPELIYRLFHRFAPYQAFPGKAMAFLEGGFERAEVDGKNTLRASDIVQQFIDQTGLPELFLRDELPLAQEDAIAFFTSRVIGQAAACHQAASLVTTFKAGLNDPQRPIGVQLFCGPTGVGKTQLAKALSEYFFGHGEERNRLVRLDMSEYGTLGAAERLITNANGEPSDLIKRVRQQPFVVVLFDEIEKADAQVFDVLLSLFDEGRITDRYGRTTSFRSAVILMTSNIGAEKAASIGFDKASGRAFTSEIQAFFRPEFFNRIDAVVAFNAINEASLLAITRKELAEISAREGLLAYDTKLRCTERLVQRVAEAGYDARYGARPLQRTIEQMVVAPLSRFLLEHPEAKGKIVEADVTDDGVRFTQLS
ncbi:MAG: ATP-dependent Clp protease ATP-binding subunit [Acidobacteria bacterium]|nr:ATP-dependent Clp protease ATP-binding subunit [Acidobacteriota bacterium]